MLDEPRRQRRAPDLEANTAPDLLHDDLRRRDQRETPPDSCHLTKSEIAKTQPAAVSRREKMAATRSTRSTTRIRRMLPRPIMSGRLTASMRQSATGYADASSSAMSGS